jgi:hypothetical protein
MALGSWGSGERSFAQAVPPRVVMWNNHVEEHSRHGAERSRRGTHLCRMSPAESHQRARLVTFPRIRFPVEAAVQAFRRYHLRVNAHRSGGCRRGKRPGNKACDSKD